MSKVTGHMLLKYENSNHSSFSGFAGYFNKFFDDIE